MEQPFEGFQSVEELHRHRAAVLGDLPKDKRAVIENIEKAAFGIRQTRVENIYGVVGEHASRRHLRDTIALYLKHHPQVQFATSQIAKYLHCTEEEAVLCVERMEIEIVERAGSTTSQDLMVVGRQLGVVIGELVRTFA